jgi:hypothetical protein
MYTQYQIANGDSEQALIQQVGAAMQSGWQPTGGIGVVPVMVNGQQQYKFVQAMVHT